MHDYKFPLERLRIEKLRESDLLSYFDCGNEDLNDFLKNEAYAHQSIWCSVTWLIKYENNIVGYFSLLNDAIELTSSHRRKMEEQAYQ